MGTEDGQLVLEQTQLVDGCISSDIKELYEEFFHFGWSIGMHVESSFKAKTFY